MANLINTMDSLTEQLRQLEREIDLEEFEHSGRASSLGEKPAQAFASITEFKAAIDRIGGRVIPNSMAREAGLTVVT